MELKIGKSVIRKYEIFVINYRNGFESNAPVIYLNRGSMMEYSDFNSGAAAL